MLGQKAIHNWAYLSTESVLFDAGYISQQPSQITFVSAKSLSFEIAGKSFKSRQLKDLFLYQKKGITQNASLFIASPVRAIADMLYFNPKAHFDKKPDWRAVKKLQKEMTYPLTPERYDFT